MKKTKTKGFLLMLDLETHGRLLAAAKARNPETSGRGLANYFITEGLKREKDKNHE